MLWRAPQSDWNRCFIFVYEYAIKSRRYALGCLFVFLFCAFWQRRGQSPVMVAIILALMANVDILFMIVSMAAVLALAADRLIGKPPVGEELPARGLARACTRLSRGHVRYSTVCRLRSDIRLRSETCLFRKSKLEFDQRRGARHSL